MQVFEFLNSHILWVITLRGYSNTLKPKIHNLCSWCR